MGDKTSLFNNGKGIEMVEILRSRNSYKKYLESVEGIDVDYNYEDSMVEDPSKESIDLTIMLWENKTL